MQTARVSDRRLYGSRTKPHIYRSEYVQQVWFALDRHGVRHAGHSPRAAYQKYMEARR